MRRVAIALVLSGLVAALSSGALDHEAFRTADGKFDDGALNPGWSITSTA